MEYIPGITIVIPVHNRAKIVGRTLESVEAQTLRPLHVVLVDNASTDGTPDVLREWAGKAHGIDVVVVSELQPGAAAARNRGLQEVRTEWTMFFDSDDCMHPDHCSRALACAEGYDIIGWNVSYHNADGHKQTKKFYNSDTQFHNLFHGTMATQRYMARTQLFFSAGCWGNSIRYWNDIELGARMMATCPRIRHAGDRITVDVYFLAESITGPSYSANALAAQDTLRAIARTLGPHKKFWTDIKNAILAADCTREGSHIGKEIMCSLLSGCRPLRQRVILKSAYLYRLYGGRGIARILRPFI